MVSHVASLRVPADGLRARLALTAEARSTLDLQYYQWNGDTAGHLMLDAVLAAADRGVEVRLLVDDLRFRNRTRLAAALCLHPQVEVRLFNPWTQRSSAVAQAVQFVRQFSRLDRRMHNKLLIADDERAIIGGRNLADTHFGLSHTCNLVDHDLYVTGDVVIRLGAVFESYWASEPAVSARQFDDDVTTSDLDGLRNDLRERIAADADRFPTAVASGTTWQDRVAAQHQPVASEAIEVTSDSPGIWDNDGPTQVIAALHRAVDQAEREVVVVTPFFVPSEHDVGWYGRLVARGVRIRLLTNSLASNSGTISNSGLDRRRKDVVDAGVELYELRAAAAVKPDWETAPCRGRYLGLHAKLYTIDGTRVFLGSVNLDPRSKFINTEVGMLVDDAGFAQQTSAAIEQLMTPENTWRVELDPERQLVWSNDRETTRRQPARGTVQRIADGIFRLLPIGRYI